MGVEYFSDRVAVFMSFFLVLAVQSHSIICMWLLDKCGGSITVKEANLALQGLHRTFS